MGWTMRTDSTLSPTVDRSESLRHQIYNDLREKLRHGQIGPDDRLIDVKIAKSLGISRMPVREALLQLEAEGLVTFGTNRRPVVTVLTPKDILELFEIRIVLEGLAGERAVPRMTDEHFRELEMQLARMDRAIPDTKKWLALHDDFHDMIYDHAEMPRLSEDICRIRQAVRPYMFMYIEAYRSFEMPGVEHSALPKILRNGNPDQARTALVEHIRSTAASVVYFLMNRNVGSGEPANKNPINPVRI